MILVDANILLYAENTRSKHREPARRWWDDQLSGEDTVCLCWAVLLAFIRIATHPRLFERPLTRPAAIDRIQEWLDQPPVRVIHPTDRHWPVLQELIVDSQATGNLVTDAHLAALAIEHGCVLYSTDADFRRFRGLKWRNPLES